MTLDEAIKYCLEVAEGYEIRVKLGGELASLIDCPQQAANFRKIAEWLMELKEAKRLLKLAGEDIHDLLCDRTDVSRGKGQACNICSYISKCDCCYICEVKEELRRWRYEAEALALIGEDGEQNDTL